MKSVRGREQDVISFCFQNTDNNEELSAQTHSAVDTHNQETMQRFAHCCIAVLCGPRKGEVL